jgi:hypothetical protein
MPIFLKKVVKKKLHNHNNRWLKIVMKLSLPIIELGHISGNVSLCHVVDPKMSRYLQDKVVSYC